MKVQAWAASPEIPLKGEYQRPTNLVLGEQVVLMPWWPLGSCSDALFPSPFLLLSSLSFIKGEGEMGRGGMEVRVLLFVQAGPEFTVLLPQPPGCYRMPGDPDHYFAVTSSEAGFISGCMRLALKFRAPNVFHQTEGFLGLGLASALCTHKPPAKGSRRNRSGSVPEPIPAAEPCLDKSVWDEQANLSPNA